MCVWVPDRLLCSRTCVRANMRVDIIMCTTMVCLSRYETMPLYGDYGSVMSCETLMCSDTEHFICMFLITNISFQVGVEFQLASYNYNDVYY